MATTVTISAGQECTARIGTQRVTVTVTSGEVTARIASKFFGGVRVTIDPVGPRFASGRVTMADGREYTFTDTRLSRQP